MAGDIAVGARRPVREEEPPVTPRDERRAERADAGPAPSVTIGAVPESDKSWLKPVAAIPPSTTGAVTLPKPGRPSIPEMGGTCTGTGGDIAGGRAEPAAAATPAAPSPPAYITVAFAAATPNSE